MKLLCVVPEYPPHCGGGISTFYHSYLPEVVRLGHKVHVLVSNAFSKEHAAYEASGVTVEFLSREKINLYLRQFERYHATPILQRHLATAWAAHDFVNSGSRYDVVETTDWGLLFVPWIISSESPPSIVQLHASIGQISFYDPQADTQLQDSFVRLLEKELLTCAAALQANSKSNAHFWQTLTGQPVEHIDPAIQIPTRVDSGGDRSASGLVVGRVQYWKGPTVLCEALRLLGDRAPTIDWIGRDTAYQDSDGSMSAYLSEKYGDMWGEKIHPKGAFSAEKTSQHQAAAEFVVIPSVWDVFNYTCVEAMAQEKVVLCSTGAGARDLIDDGVNGLVFEADNPEALAESMKRLLSMDKAARTAMGKAARRTVETRLNSSLVVRQRIEAFEKAIQQGRSSVQPNPWLIDAVTPQASRGRSLEFLDRLPLGELSHYVAKRSLKKVFA